jgi:hypothetical protein
MLCVYPKEMKAITITPPAPCKRGQAATLDVTLTDGANQPVKGRQLLEVRILDPGGSVRDESGLYRAVDGTARVPFRPARNDAEGKWSVEVRERSSGLTAKSALVVDGGG